MELYFWLQIRVKLIAYFPHILYWKKKKNNSHFCFWLLSTESFFVLSLNCPEHFTLIEIPTKNLYMLNFSHLNYCLNFFFREVETARVRVTLVMDTEKKVKPGHRAGERRVWRSKMGGRGRRRHLSINRVHPPLPSAWQTQPYRQVNCFNVYLCTFCE